jgi:hypothetical protein
MTLEETITIPPEISLEYAGFEEFCSENIGRELTYLGLVEKSPLDMDTITIAFSIRHLVRLSKPLRDKLLESAINEQCPEIKTLLALKGIELDKKHAQTLRNIIFAFRDSGDPDLESRLVRGLQLLAISRERDRVVLNCGETYRPPDEGWTEEDFDGDEYGLATVRSVEENDWRRSEEN